VIWAVHPLASSAVIYVAGRADPLAAMFGFAGLYFCLRSDRKEGPPKAASLALGCLLFLGAALSKESGLVFPGLWVISLFLGRRGRSVLPAAAVVALVIVVYSVLRAGADHIPPPARKPVPALVRPIIVARAVAEYAGLIVFPLNLRMERDVETRSSGFHEASITHASWRELQTVLGALIIAALAWWTWRALKRDRAEATFLLLGLVAYLPISGIVSLNATVAEHWLYVPLAFFVAAGARFGVTWVSRQPRWIQRVAMAVVAAWILFLGIRTSLRADDWREHRTFLERTVAGGGDTARMLINLAADQLRKSELHPARATLLKALQKEPNEPFAQINLAAVALKEKKFAEARQILTRAVEIPLISAQAHEMLAVLEYQEHGRVDLRRLHLATRTGSRSWNIEKRYLEVLVQSGMTDAAIQELRRVLQTEWYRAESWAFLSQLLEKTNRPGEAEAARARAQRYDVHLGQ
jgi:tetratricopeptide (TPR) repeat protein